MKIELKNFKHYDRLSEETYCFIGNIWVNGIKCGYAENSGKGGCTSYHHEGTEQSRNLIRQAEDYCLTLPPMEYEYNGEKYAFDMNLHTYLDNLADEMIKAKNKEKDDQKLRKEMQKGIVIGTDNEYRVISFKLPMKEMWEKHPDFFRKTLTEKLDKYKDKGYRLLNTNIPQQFITN